MGRIALIIYKCTLLFAVVKLLFLEISIE